MSRVQAAVLCDEATSSLTPFAFLKLVRKKKKILKHHGAVNESSSEQQFHKSDAITFVV